MEALYEGSSDAGLTVIGALTDSGERIGEKKVHDIKLKIEVPELLSIMTTGKADGYVPGIKDLVNGNPERGILSVSEMMERGTYARQVLTDYKMAKEMGDTETMSLLAAKFKDKDFTENYFKYFGYSYFEHPWQVIPSVPVTFYSFRIMVGLGFFFILLFILAIYFSRKMTLEQNRWFLWMALFSIPLAYLASELGWIVTEMGRQPWIIQNLMPVSVAVSNISAGAVQTTFWLFAVLFTALLIAEVSIMAKQIKIGPKHLGGVNMTLMISHAFLQDYWWMIISLLAGLLVFLMFVQGGQSFIFSLPRNDMQRKMMVNALGPQMGVHLHYPCHFRRSLLCLIPAILCHQLRRGILGLDGNSLQLHHPGCGIRVPVKTVKCVRHRRF